MSDNEYRPQRRVAGFHNIRLDGLTDIVLRSRGASVLDIGCNRGLIGFEMANNGASRVHGCDIFPEGVRTAREIFADLRDVESRFEVVDLTKEMPFPDERYDITLMIATYHKLKREMIAEALTSLIVDVSKRTEKFFVWRGNRQLTESESEMETLDRELGWADFKRVHTSYLSTELGPAAIWAR